MSNKTHSQTALACATGAACGTYDVLTSCNGISGVHWYLDGAKRNKDRRAADQIALAQFLHRQRGAPPEAVYIHFRSLQTSGLPTWTELSPECRRAYAVFAAVYLEMVAEDAREAERAAREAAAAAPAQPVTARRGGIGETIGQRDRGFARGGIMERIT